MICLVSLFIVLVTALPQGDPAGSLSAPVPNLDDPSSGDPETPPQGLAAPPKSANPWAAGGIPVVPAECTDASNPSEDCFTALFNAAAGDDTVHALGGYLSHDGTCAEDGKQDQLETAAWDATILAIHGKGWPNGARGAAAGRYWMGPDYPSQQKRIQDNFARAADFKMKGNSYITVSCKDTKKNCGRMIDGKAVGGYAWTSTGWFGYKYHYATLCPVFFTLETLDTLFVERDKEVAGGDTSKVTDMDWMKSTGQFFLHEMMHTDLIGQPHINDEYVDGRNEVGSKAYGPKLVHRLAQQDISKTGGATRASTNADSYAMLANGLYWWAVTGYFPGVQPKKKDVETPEEAAFDQSPLALYLDLGNVTDTSTVDFNALYDFELQGFANEIDSAAPPSPPAAPSGTSLPPPPPPTSASPIPPPASSAPSTVDCDVKYEFLFNRFTISGKNFDAAKFGMDGSGLKEEIKGCGAVTDWSFSYLTNEEFQWKASGNLPIGTKACVGRAVISAGGSSKDDCTGAG